MQVGDGGDLGQVFDAMATSHPALVRRLRDEQGSSRRYVNVYVDGEDVRLSGRRHRTSAGHRRGAGTPVSRGRLRLPRGPNRTVPVLVP